MMKIPLVDLHAQYLSIKNSIDEAIAKVIAESAYVGPKYVERFERNFAELYGVKHCIGLANGTDALFIALKILGIGEGDEVITVANSWISTAETISQTGAKPVFIDIEADFYNIDVAKIEEKITDKTKAILPVHLYGHSADMDAILDICKRYDLKLIEDCAQAHFAEYKHKRVGLFGQMGTFSFYPSKNLGAYGDAGAVITNDDDLALACRKYANQGAIVKHQHDSHGINSRMDGLQAAVLNAKLPHVLAWTESRREIAAKYRKLLTQTEHVVLPKEAENTKHVYHLFVIRTEQRDQLKSYLAANGIESSIHYPLPLPFQKVYKHFEHKLIDFPVAVSCANEILSLPMYPELNNAMMMTYLGEKINDFISRQG